MSRILSHRRATAACAAALLVTSAIAFTGATASSADPTPAPDTAVGSFAVPNIQQVLLSSDGVYSYVRTSDDAAGLAVYRNSDHALVTTIDPAGHKIRYVAVDPADGRIIVEDGSYQTAAIGVIDPSTYALTWYDLETKAGAYGLTLTNDNTRVYTKVGSTVAYLDLSTMTMGYTGIHLGYSFLIGFSPDDATVYAITYDFEDFYLEAYNLATDAQLGSTLLVGGGSAAAPTAIVTPTGEVYGSNDYDIWQFDASVTQKIRHIDAPVGVISLASSRTGKTLYATGTDYAGGQSSTTLAGIDAATGDTRFRILTGQNLQRLALDKSGATGAAMDYVDEDSTVTLFALSDVLGEVPGAPKEVAVTTKAHGVGVSFTAPTNTGTGSISGYTVSATDATDTTLPAITATGTSSPIALFGLAGGHTYTVTVAATNAIGTGAASDPSNTFVARYPQTIQFQNIPNAPAVGGSFTASGQGGGSAAPVTFAIAPTTTNGSCTLAGGIVTFVHAGTCRITANQRGNTAYEAALPTTATLGVHRAAQALTFASTPLDPALVGASYDVAVTSTGSPSGIIVRVTQSSRGVCSLDANGYTVHLTKAGTCVVRANQPRSADYLGATTITQTIAVTAP